MEMTTTKSTCARLEHALQQKLQELAAAPMTATSLLQIEEMAKLARETLAVVKDPRAFATRSKQGGSIVMNTGSVGYVGAEDGEALAPSSSAETFATRVMREVIAGVSAVIGQKPGPSAMDLMTSLKMAKELQLPSVEQALRAQLEGLSAAALPLPPPPKPPALLAPGRKAKNGRKTR